MLCRFVCALLLPLAAWPASHRVLVRTVDGNTVEGDTSLASVGQTRLDRVLSIHSATPASDAEQGRIEADMVAIQGKDRKARDLAVEELTAIGLPVMTPLLKTY